MIWIHGGGAGGHLAALLGTTGGVEELEGAQPQRANAKGLVVYQLLGGGADQKTDLARLASPAWHVTEDDAPLLIFHGDRDSAVLLDQAERLHEVYVGAGLPSQLVVLEGAGHGGRQFFSGESREILLRFLRENLE